jgi:DNA-directed RNA polymerase subunit RPC12/RpoP
VANSTQACPSCGAELRFSAAASIYIVCSYCGSMVVRGDRTLESIGRVASLPEDISPLQIGTTLRYRDQRYTLLGRYWMGWADGVWTEWFMDDGTSQGWLAHAQGFFSVAFEHAMLPSLETAPWPAAGMEIIIDDLSYRVTDLKSAKCIASEGELPFAAKPQLMIGYADMLSSSGGFATLEETEGARSLFVGQNVDFDDLHFANLRPLEGWTPPRDDLPSSS